MLSSFQRNVEFYQALTKKDLALVGDVWLKSSTVQVKYIHGDRKTLPC
jgi:hypothetical protein